MVRVVLGGIALFAAVLIAVDFLFEKTTWTSEELARMRLYDLWIKTGTLTVYLK